MSRRRTSGGALENLEGGEGGREDLILPSLGAARLDLCRLWYIYDMSAHTNEHLEVMPHEDD